MFDFDGTLAPIVLRPKLARLSAAHRRILASLAANPNITVAIVTGRSLADIRKKVSIPRVILAANHGFEIARGRRVVYPGGRRFLRPMALLAKELIRGVGSVPGVLIEAKGFAVAVHYRLTPRRLWKGLERRIRALSRPWLKRYRLRMTGGKRIWEIRPARHWNKGDAALWIRRRFAPGSVPWYFGDDLTDEDAFKALDRVGGMTVVIGRHRSRAGFRLADVEELWRILRLLRKDCFNPVRSRR